MPPYLSKQAPWFTFLVHPRDVRDLDSVGGSSIVSANSSSEAEYVEKMCSLPPTVVGDVRFGFEPAWGEVVAVVRMPGQILRPEGRAQIEEAVRLAAYRGSSVVGLGALTAPATRGGLTLLPDLPKKLTLTTGNAYTAAMACRNVVDTSQAVGLGTAAVVAVVGCTGSVGVAASRLLADAGFELVLIGRTVERVQKELGDLAAASLVSADLADVYSADIVLLLTSDTAALMTPETARPGTVVIDFAHPVNIQVPTYPLFAQRDVTVVQGGLVMIPGFSCSTDFRLAHRRASLACMAETYLFAKEGIREHSVGLATVELARYLDDLALRRGFEPWPLGLPMSAATAG